MMVVSAARFFAAPRNRQLPARSHLQIVKDAARWFSLRYCYFAVLEDKQRLKKGFNTQISTFTTSVTPCCLTIHIPYHSLGLATYYTSSSSFVEIFWNPASEDDIQLRTSVCLEMRWFLLDYI
jgi:hypothetical protein